MVVVDSVRSSEFASYDKDSYEYAVKRSSLVSVRDLLKDASFAYDRETLGERVVFFDEQISSLFEKILESKKQLSSTGQSFYLVDFLKSLDVGYVLCSVDGGLYGPKWLLPEISQYPKIKIPELLSVSDLIAFMQNIIMQKIAIIDGLEMGIVNNLYFKKRVGVEQSKILYDS